MLEIQLTLTVLIIIAGILALVPSIRKRLPWLRFPLNLLKFLLGFVFPPIYLALGFLGGGPFCISGIRHGWFDCFPQGQLLLTPLVFWAVGAFGLLEFDGIEEQFKPRIIIPIGYLNGAVYLGVSILYEIKFRSSASQDIQLILLISFLWYLIRSIQLLRKPVAGLAAYGLACGGSFLLWFAALDFTRRTCNSLPKECAGCYVVSAANQGHDLLVGPKSFAVHEGKTRLSTRQLDKFRRFERVWRNLSPTTHSNFRIFYDATGRRLAKLIRDPWIADLVYLALLPIEFVITVLLPIGERISKPKRNP